MAAPPPTSSVLRLWAAVLVSVIGAGIAGWWPGPTAGPVGLLAWGLVIAFLQPSHGSTRALVVAAILVRIPFLLSEPRWSDDVWRYVWEGQVWRAGFNPFTDAPDSAVLVPLRDAVWARVNHREVSTIYPPLAQALAAALPSVLAWKLVMGACDVGTAWVLHRRRAEAGWLWALLPLPALESAGSGHLEGAGLLCTALALAGWPAFAWLGAMVKLLPGVLLVRAGGRTWVAAMIATGLALVPIWSPSLLRGFETYRATWAYNGSVYPVVCMAIDEPHARRLLQGVGAAVVAGALWRARDSGRIAVWTFGAFVVLSPTVHPWYVLWPLLAALWNGQRAWTVLAVLVPLTYVVLGSYDAAASVWTEPSWPRWVVYPAFYLSLGWEGWRRLTRAGPEGVG